MVAAYLLVVRLLRREARDAFRIIGVMETERLKVMVNMSSDHAGIAKALKHLEREIYRVVAHIDDARKLRDYIGHLDFESQQWCIDHQVDMRGWMQRTRKAAG